MPRVPTLAPDMPLARASRILSTSFATVHPLSWPCGNSWWTIFCTNVGNCTVTFRIWCGRLTGCTTRYHKSLCYNMRICLCVFISHSNISTRCTCTYVDMHCQCPVLGGHDEAQRCRFGALYGRRYDVVVTMLAAVLGLWTGLFNNSWKCRWWRRKLFVREQWFRCILVGLCQQASPPAHVMHMCS